MATASIRPRAFVKQLIDPGLAVDGYPHRVGMRKYLCSNLAKDSADAARLKKHLPKIVEGTADAGAVQQLDKTGRLQMVFGGQGYPDDIRAVLAIVWRNRDAVKGFADGKDTPFARFFTDPNPLQAMVDARLFGYDCMGFVNQYLLAAGVYKQYAGHTPRLFLDDFPPITSTADLDDLGVVVWVHGEHVTIIDAIWETNWSAKSPHAVIDMCQSSDFSSFNGVSGPQTNKKVKLVLQSQVSYLDLAAYKDRLKQPVTDAAGQPVLKKNGKPLLVAESPDARTAAQKELEVTGATGYNNGLFFSVQGGDPPIAFKNAHVYVGVMPRLERAWEESPTVEDG